MEVFGVAIFACFVLYLIDKNQQWQRFWKLMKWSAIVGTSGCALYLGMLLYLNHRDAEKAKAVWQSVPESPPTFDPNAPYSPAKSN